MNLIFDLDGTLVDSAPDIHAAVTLLLADHCLPALDLPTIRSFIGDGTEMLTRRVIAACGVEADLHQWHAAFMAHYAREMVTLTRPYPGVLQALTDLALAGARLGVCTNKPQGPARAILEATGLLPLIDVITGGDTLPQRKPAPEPLWQVACALGGEAVFVGDSEVDAAAAQAASMPLLLFTGGYRKTAVEDLPHAARFDRFEELPGLWQTGFAPRARVTAGRVAR